MKFFLLSAVMGAAGTVQIVQQPENDDPSTPPVQLAQRTENPAKDYFTAKNPTLNKTEKKAMQIGDRWKAGAAQNLLPVTGKEGAIQFAFGAQQVSIVCAVLQICDVALQPGEKIVGQPHIGDATRWVIEPALSGSGDQQVQHIVVKPLDVGLKTSLMIPTDRRTYHLQLKSHKTQYMAKISFSYPNEIQARWQDVQRQVVQEKAIKTLSNTDVNIDDLDFNYAIKGRSPWKPIRVYDDGEKTTIHMPDSVSKADAPVLLIARGRGDEEATLVNYNFAEGKYQVQGLFDKAILIAGVGRKQRKITLNYRGRR